MFVTSRFKGVNRFGFNIGVSGDGERVFGARVFLAGSVSSGIRVRIFSTDSSGLHVFESRVH